METNNLTYAPDDSCRKDRNTLIIELMNCMKLLFRQRGSDYGRRQPSPKA